MKMRLFLTCALVAAVAAGLQTVDAQIKKGKTRAATTKQLMKGVVAANCGALKKAIEAESVDWDEVALRAAILNESGYGLMDDGRCPDGEWAKGAKAIQSATVEVLAAAEKKDVDAAKAAFARVTGEGCATCHKAHKK